MPAALQIAYDVILPIFIAAGLGFWFGRRFQPDPRTLSRLGIYVFSPALVFHSIANSTLQPTEIGQMFVLVVALYLITMLIARLLIAVRPSIAPEIQSAFILSVVLANSGNYGISFVDFAFGDAGVQIAVLVFVMTSLMANTLGIYIASSGTASVLQGIKNVFSVPMVYAAVLGFWVNFGAVTLPLPIARSVELMGQAAVPLFIVLLGVQLARISIRGNLQPVIGTITLASVTRLLVAPFIILALTALLGITGFTRGVLLVQLSTPTAVYATLLATEFGSDAQFTTSVIFITTIASLFTLSVIMAVAVV